jgi:REP element-mobilizing transposase RayT
VTICTVRRRPILGEIVGDRLQLSATGLLAESCWLAIPVHFPHVTLDVWTVQPDHVHGILMVGARHVAPAPPVVQMLPSPGGATSQHLPSDPGHAPHRNVLGPHRPGSLPAIIRAYKASVTRLAGGGTSVWQSRYHDGILRDAGQVARARDYVRGHRSPRL